MADVAQLADPTKPLNYKTKSLKKEYRSALPQLQSILTEGEQRRAILNNKLYKTGQWVNGYQITHIKKDVVLLRYKTKSYKLALYPKKERFIK